MEDLVKPYEAPEDPANAFMEGYVNFLNGQNDLSAAMLGIAAEANSAQSEVAMAQIELGYAQLEAMLPLYREQVQIQRDLADVQNAISVDRWQHYKSVYQPKELAFVEEAWAGRDPRRAVSQISADINLAFDKSQAAEGRALTGMGVNPNSGRFASQQRQSSIARAVAEAGARNQTRTAVEDQNYARRAQAVNIGLGLPSEATAMAATASGMHNSATNALGGMSGSYGQALGALSAAANTQQMGTSALLGAYSSALGSATQMAGTSGNIYASILGQRNQANIAQMQNDTARRGQDMSLVGGIVGAGLGALSSF